MTMFNIVYVYVQYTIFIQNIIISNIIHKNSGYPEFDNNNFQELIYIYNISL